MSHSSGLVKFKDNTKMFFDYNDDSDFCVPMLYETLDKLSENWRKVQWKECNCSNKEVIEEIVIKTQYSGSWKGKACRKCKCITEGWNPEFVDDNKWITKNI